MTNASSPEASIPNAYDPFLAVFNGHINNADARARAQMSRTERGRKWLADVERLESERKGIMGIFDDWKKPTGVRRYTKLVTKFANERTGS
jgi:hypothetical protein